MKSAEATWKIELLEFPYPLPNQTIRFGPKAFLYPATPTEHARGPYHVVEASPQKVPLMTQAQQWKRSYLAAFPPSFRAACHSDLCESPVPRDREPLPRTNGSLLYLRLPWHGDWFECQNINSQFYGEDCIYILCLARLQLKPGARPVEF